MNNKKEPSNVEAEMQALGCAYVSKLALERVCEELTPEMFYDKKNEIIFDALCELHHNNEVIDATILKNQIEKKHSIREAGGIEYITDVISSATGASRIDSYINIIIDKALRRKLIKTCEDIENRAKDESINSNEIIDGAEQAVFNVSKNRKSGEFKTSDQVAASAKKILETRSKNDSEITGLATGFVDLDKKTTGLHASELIILAARPAMGKTSLALNIAYNAAIDSGKSVAIFNLEMSAEQLMERILSSVSAVDSYKIRTGHLNHNDWKKVNIALSEISKAPLYFEDNPNITVGDVRAKCRRLANKGNGLGLVVIDHIQILDDGTSMANSTQQKISNISKALKRMAIELGVPVLALSQLSRAVEGREDKRPLMSDLRDSGTIEQDADIVALLYRDDYYTRKDKLSPNSVSELNIGKNRSGDGGTIKLLFQRNISLFSNFIESEEQE